jgi:hypothetical protein
MGRASVIYFSDHREAQPAQRMRNLASPKISSDNPDAAAKTLRMAPAEAHPRPSNTPDRTSPKQNVMANARLNHFFRETVLPQPAFPIPPTDAAGKGANTYGAGDELPNTAMLPPRRTPQQLLNGGAWIVWRPDAAGQPLGAGGQLGGSQVGARLLLPFALKDRLRLSLRAYAPLAQMAAYEVAPGISIHPFPKIPVELIVEQRLRGGAQVKDATSLFIAGGSSVQKPGNAWRTDVYGQAGMVGLDHPLLFADGTATVRKSIEGRHAIGIGLWGGIQPGLKRLDVGPSATTMIGPPALNIRLSLDWRVRIAGDARPGSGIAISVAKDF